MTLQVVKLVSETFNYPKIDRGKTKMKQSIYEHFPKLGRRFNRLGLKPKVINEIFIFRNEE